MEVCVLTPADLGKYAHLFPAELLPELPGDELLLGCVQAAPPAAVGILMAHVEEREVLIDWLYVEEEYRRQGGGKEMPELLVQGAEASGRADAVSIVFSERDDGLDIAHTKIHEDPKA